MKKNNKKKIKKIGDGILKFIIIVFFITVAIKTSYVKTMYNDSLIINSNEIIEWEDLFNTWTMGWDFTNQQINNLIKNEDDFINIYNESFNTWTKGWNLEELYKTKESINIKSILNEKDEIKWADISYINEELDTSKNILIEKNESNLLKMIQDNESDNNSELNISKEME